jgi:Flp pilus assembly secretin CpaC
MDLRVMGNLFRNTTEEVQRMERLILITPRIITYDMLDSTVPQRVNEQNFAVNPTSPDYSLNEKNTALKARSGSGCFSSSGSVFTEPLPVTRQNAPDPAGTAPVENITDTP